MTFRIKRKSKSKKVYKRNRNKFSRRGRKRVTRRVSNRKRKRVTRKQKAWGGMKSARTPNNQNAKTTTQKRLEKEGLEQAALEQAVIQENSQMSGEEALILRDALANLANLPNNQHREIQSSSCVNGPDYFELPGYCEFSAYIKIPTLSEEEKARGIEIVEEIEKRKGLLRGENGRNVFQELGPGIQLNKLIKMVVVNVAGKYTILWSYANMLNYNYAEDYFKKWVTKNDDGTFTIRSNPKQVVIITREIIEDIERDRQFNDLLVSKNLLLTRSYYPNKYNQIINRYFSTRYDMANTVFICPIYEIPHSAIANDYKGFQLEKSTEVIPRPLIYAGLEGVFYTRPDGKRCFVIVNLSGHYKTPKDRMEFVKYVLETYYGYTGIRVISDPLPPSQPSSIDSDSSDAGPREEWRRFITNDPSIKTFREALDQLNSADQNPVDDSSTHIVSFSQEL